MMCVRIIHAFIDIGNSHNWKILFCVTIPQCILLFMGIRITSCLEISKIMLQCIFQYTCFGENIFTFLVNMYSVLGCLGDIFGFELSNQRGFLESSSCL